MKKDFSPEERLLRLIKGAKKKEAPKELPPQQPSKDIEKLTPSEQHPPAQRQSPQPAPAGRPEQRVPETTPPGPVEKGRPAEDIPYISKVPSLAQRAPSMPPMAASDEAASEAHAKRLSLSLPFTLQELNIGIFSTILMVILVVALGYFVYDIFFATYPDSPVVAVDGSSEPPGDRSGRKDAAVKRPFTFYSSEIGGRNIFRPQEVEVSLVPTGPTVEEVKAGLSLIGIIAGERPQAIIEHKKTGKSYFVYQGGTVENSTVVEIRQDSVLLEYQGQNFELVL